MSSSPPSFRLPGAVSIRVVHEGKPFVPNNGLCGWKLGMDIMWHVISLFMKIYVHENLIFYSDSSLFRVATTFETPISTIVILWLNIHDPIFLRIPKGYVSGKPKNNAF